ncbi:MAG: Hsp70 family protein, partial [Gemmataceae bacterium]
MFSWLNFWGRKPALAPPSPDEIARPAADAIRLPPPGMRSSPRYSFKPADDSRRSPAAPTPHADDGSEPILGIDLGTTRAAAAVVVERQIVVLTTPEGTTFTDCVVAHDRRWLVGDAAARRALTDPAAASRGFGRRLGDDSRRALGGQDCPAPFFVGLVLATLRRAAEARLGGRVR